MTTSYFIEIRGDDDLMVDTDICDVVQNYYNVTARRRRLYGCARRGCDVVNPDYLSFGGRGGKGYCLNHIPLPLRVQLWWQERKAS